LCSTVRIAWLIGPLQLARTRQQQKLLRSVATECMTFTTSLFDEYVAASSFPSFRARIARALLQFATLLNEPVGTPDQIITLTRFTRRTWRRGVMVLAKTLVKAVSEWRNRNPEALML